MPSTVTAPPSHREPLRAARPTSRRRLPRLVIVVAVVSTILAAGIAVPARAAGGYILMPRSELLGLPTSGSAWAELKSEADATFGTPNLCDQESKHPLRTFAAALVYARTGSASYGTKARAGVMAAIKTQVVGCGNATLALGRSLMAYVLAADFADLSGTNDTTFRTWLSAIRTKIIGGHGTWTSLRGTHEKSRNNWGAHAGASRIAASLYLGDSTDVARAARVTRAFLGDRSAYTGFTQQPDSDALSWTCSGSSSTFTPVNGACTRGTTNVDGAIVLDIARGGPRQWPPGEDGISYQLESIQGVGMQVELLYRNGYSDAWSWSSSAMKRAAGIVTRSAAAGGKGWNETQAGSQMPWLLNKRYGTKIPTKTNGIGRVIGFTSWLYGNGGAGSPAPSPTPSPTSGSAPVADFTGFRVATTRTVSTTGIRTLVSWRLAKASTGIRRYELQVKRVGGTYRTLTLSSSTATSHWATLTPGGTYVFRVRAIDRAGRVGPWDWTSPRRALRYSETSASLRWSGSWARATSRSYIGTALRYTRQNGATATLAFNGSSVAWVGPIGPTRGKANVYIDGRFMATVDLRASTFRARSVVFAKSLADGRHTMTIRGLGTSGRPVVALDALYVIDPS